MAATNDEVQAHLGLQIQPGTARSGRKHDPEGTESRPRERVLRGTEDEANRTESSQAKRSPSRGVVTPGGAFRRRERDQLRPHLGQPRIQVLGQTLKLLLTLQTPTGLLEDGPPD